MTTLTKLVIGSRIIVDSDGYVSLIKGSKQLIRTKNKHRKQYLPDKPLIIYGFKVKYLKTRAQQLAFKNSRDIENHFKNNPQNGIYLRRY